LRFGEYNHKDPCNFCESLFKRAKNPFNVKNNPEGVSPQSPGLL
jgi:hypothetical protein